MKLISDFDGVWTNPLGEAEAVRAEARRQAAALTGTSEAEAEAGLAAVSRAMLPMAEQFGWVIEGAISAFSDEDPFIHNNAISHFLELLPDNESWVDEGEAKTWMLTLRSAAIAKHGDLASYANQVFFKGVSDFLEAEKPKASEDVVREIAAFIDEGHELVIVSNSSTGKITSFLERSGMPYCVGGPEAQEEGKIRVRGGAMKFIIGTDASATVSLGGRTVRIDRASYEGILAEEAGDAVIGDVVSLDLALPHIRTQRGIAEMACFLVRRSYTPDWSVAVAEAEGFRVLSDLHEFPAAWRARV